MPHNTALWNQQVLHLLEGVGPHITRYATYTLLQNDRQTYYPRTCPELLARFEDFEEGVKW